MYSKSIVGDGRTLRVRQRGVMICLAYPFLRSTVAHLISSHVDALTARRGSSLTFRLAIPLDDENVGQSLFEQWYYEHPNYSLLGVARRFEHSEHFERWGGGGGTAHDNDDKRGGTREMGQTWRGWASFDSLRAPARRRLFDPLNFLRFFFYSLPEVRHLILQFRTSRFHSI